MNRQMASCTRSWEESKDLTAPDPFSAGWWSEFKPQEVMLAKFHKTEKKDDAY